MPVKCLDVQFIDSHRKEKNIRLNIRGRMEALEVKVFIMKSHQYCLF